MSVPTQITDHAALAVAQLLSVVGRKDPAMVELATILGGMVQDAEDLIWSLLEERSLDVLTVGVQLDAWGVVLGRSRAGLSDAAYLRVLLAWQGALRSQGRRNRIITAMKQVADATAVEYSDLFPAAFMIVLLTSTPLSVELTAVAVETCEAAAPSGVGFQVIQGDDIIPFRFDTSGQGFDEGLFTERIDA